MEFSTALICIFFTTLAASYAWGMRGAVIGGEKGAMLPGAFIGLILARFSGGAISECFWIPAAAGLMGMTFGGTETYGETIGMVLHRGRPDYRPIKGYTGLAMKGALWFSICGGFIAISMASMSLSFYKTSDLVIFCLLIPAIQQIGCRIFNCPYDKEKGIYPRIFYSLTRREEWGGNLTLLMAMIAMTVIRGDDFALAMISAGFFFGAVGWIAAMKCYELAVFPMRNGRYFFGKLYQRGIVDGWKLMEFVLGAFGGFGLSLTFCIRYEFIEKYNEAIKLNGIRFPDETFNDFIPAIILVCAAGILAINIYQFVCSKKNKKVNYFFWDQIERPLYNVIPMLFVLLGSVLSAKIMTMFMLVFVCCIKCVLDRFENSKLLPIGQTVSAAVCGAVLAGCFYDVYSPFVLMLAGTVPYLIAELIWAARDNSKKGRKFRDLILKTSFATVFPCFLIQSALILFTSWKFFNF